MAVVVNTHNEQEEKVLIAFLESLKYDYQTDTDDIALTAQQAEKVLTRDKELAQGSTTSRPWEDIRKELKSVYR